MNARHLAAVPDQPRRVVLYVRVSALMGRGGDDFHSPDVQAGAMRRATAGMREVETVEDIDVSGTTFSRKGLDRVRELVEAGRVDVIAVYDLSRLGRNVLESLQFLKWLSDRGVTIISASEQVDTSTPAGEMMLITMLNLAQYRSREIGRAWKQIIARRGERGQHHGTPPTGLVRDEGGRLAPHPVHGAAVAEAFRRYADGDGVRDIRRRLRAVTGLAMAPNVFKRMLRNPAYRGAIRLGDGTLVEGAHEPLVDADTWARVSRRLATDAQTPPRLRSPTYSLSGLGRCAECDGRTNIRRSRVGPQIFCRAHHEITSSCQGCGTTLLRLVEDAVVDQVRAYVEKLRGDVGAQEARYARTARAGASAAALERELAETRRAMVQVTTRWAREQRGDDDPVFTESMAQLRETEQGLIDRLAEVQEVATGPPPQRVVELADELLAIWPEADGADRNEALRDLVQHVTIARPAFLRQPAADRVEIIWR